jgi:hypothetical protein
MTKSICWIGIELCNPPKYDGLTYITTFVHIFEAQVPEQQRLLALDIVLKATPARWWVTHKENIEDWKQCRRLIQVRFNTDEGDMMQKYTKEGNPTYHVA